jgi:hypothetical protein
VSFCGHTGWVFWKQMLTQSLKCRMFSRRRKQDWLKVKLCCWHSKDLVNLAGSSGVNTAHQCCPAIGRNGWIFRPLPCSVTRGGQSQDGHDLICARLFCAAEAVI